MFTRSLNNFHLSGSSHVSHHYKVAVMDFMALQLGAKMLSVTLWHSKEKLQLDVGYVYVQLCTSVFLQSLVDVTMMFSDM